MSPAQVQFYYRTWAAACRAHGWQTQAGRAAALAAHHAGQVWISPVLNQTLSGVYQIAHTLAAAAGREVTADDLRHACSALATGRACSSKTFTNAAFDRVLALLRLLADPTNLKNVMAYEAGGEAGERRRQAHAITQANAAYWQRICKDRFGHADLDRLTLEQLRQLSLTLRNRTAAAAAPEVAQCGSPVSPMDAAPTP